MMQTRATRTHRRGLSRAGAPRAAAHQPAEHRGVHLKPARATDTPDAPLEQLLRETPAPVGGGGEGRRRWRRSRRRRARAAQDAASSLAASAHARNAREFRRRSGAATRVAFGRRVSRARTSGADVTLGPFLGDAVARGGGAHPARPSPPALRRRRACRSGAEQRDLHARRGGATAARPRVRRGPRAVAPARATALPNRLPLRSRLEPPPRGWIPARSQGRPRRRAADAEHGDAPARGGGAATTETSRGCSSPARRRTSRRGTALSRKTRAAALTTPTRESGRAAPPVPRSRVGAGEAAARAGPRRPNDEAFVAAVGACVKTGRRLQRGSRDEAPGFGEARRLRRRGAATEPAAGPGDRAYALPLPIDGGAVVADDERGAPRSTAGGGRRPPAHDRAVHDRDSARGREQRVHRARRFGVPQSLRPVSRRDVRRDLRRGAVLVRMRERSSRFPRPVPRRHGRARARGQRTR